MKVKLFHVFFILFLILIVCGSQGVRKTIDDKDYPLTSLISNKHVLISAKCGKWVIDRRDKRGDSIEIRLGDNVNNTLRRGPFHHLST